ncbi:hypothetical protein ACFYUV_04260 [Nonomuraea sp. NPDC003560]|uniref:hypothetical protein n=1 Tax=Nonomuraea sp. NPDC003560 TaxID=3364341 RepID=UPI0036C9676A
MKSLVRLLLPLALLAALLSPAPATAARTPASAAGGQASTGQAEAMRRLSFMIGTWAGAGWTVTPSGTRQEFLQTERVRWQAGDLVISVEGQGRDKADPRTIVDSALAVINYSEATGQYRWEAFSRGYVTTVVPVVGDDTFEWSLQTPAYTSRYTLTFTGTTWHEIGETTVDGGQTWHQNFQMDLRRLY